MFKEGISDENGDWGTFGDFLGGSLSPIIGVISIYLTFVIINNQIKDNNHNDFKHTFEILYDSLDKKKNDIVLIRVSKTNPNSKIQIKKSRNKTDEIVKGAAALTIINYTIQTINNYLKKDNDYNSFNDRIKKAYEQMLIDTKRTPLPYAKTITNSLNFIEKDCNIDRKEIYKNVLFSNMNNDDLHFLYYSLIYFDKESLIQKTPEIQKIESDFALANA